MFVARRAPFLSFFLSEGSMDKAFRDVRAFMDIGQPGVARDEVTVPVVGSFESSADLGLAGRECVRWNNDIRYIKGPTALGARLMLEELGETLQAMAAGDVVEMADGLADLIYVTIWTAHAHGIPLPTVWDEVQRSNMEKFPGGVAVLDAQGKVQKPAHWTPPDIATALLPEDDASGFEEEARALFPAYATVGRVQARILRQLTRHVAYFATEPRETTLHKEFAGTRFGQVTVRELKMLLDSYDAWFEARHPEGDAPQLPRPPGPPEWVTAPQAELWRRNEVVEPVWYPALDDLVNLFAPNARVTPVEIARYDYSHPDFVALLFAGGWVVHVGDPVVRICKLVTEVKP
jgi:phosphoribosyl-ATP pyrophosphohydrolase